MVERLNTSISLTLEQINFINEQSKQFNLSKFVRSCLDDYMKLFGGENDKTIG